MRAKDLNRGTEPWTWGRYMRLQNLEGATMGSLLRSNPGSDTSFSMSATRDHWMVHLSEFGSMLFLERVWFPKTEFRHKFTEYNY